MKVRMQFKDPDAIYEIVNGKHPLPDDINDVSPRMEQERDAFSEEYFEYGDYGMFEVDTETMTARLLPCREWKS